MDFKLLLEVEKTQVDELFVDHSFRTVFKYLFFILHQMEIIVTWGQSVSQQQNKSQIL